MIARQLYSDRAGLLRRFSSSTSRVLKIGDTMKRTRTFTEEDVRLYGEISHDNNPVHFDPESARNAGFEDRLVHGMLVASLLPRILAHHFPGAVYASQSLHFKSPVYIGEEIGGEVEVITLRAMKNRYLVKFKTRCFKNGKTIAVDGEAVAVLPSLDVAQAQDLTS